MTMTGDDPSGAQLRRRPTNGSLPEAGRKRGTALEDAIRAAAYAELTEVGYTAFSVEGVAARARTGKASIYRRWPSKIELILDALCAHLPTPQQCGIDTAIADDVTTADALRRVARLDRRHPQQPGRRRDARRQVRGGR